MSALDSTPPAGLFSQLGLVIVRHKDAQPHEWPCHTLPETLTGLVCDVMTFDNALTFQYQVLDIGSWDAVQNNLAPFLWNVRNAMSASTSWYSPYSRSVLRRMLHIAAVRQPDAPMLSSVASWSFRDPVQDLNEPAVMALADRQSWTTTRMVHTMFEIPNERLVTSACLVRLWGQLCYNLSKTPLPV